MPFLIDGNNLNFALFDADGRKLGRQAMCRLLAPLHAMGERVCVVFDGAAPPAQLAAQVAGPIHVEYAAPRSADDVLLQRIAADSAPHRLTVVSSDHEIRQAARRRRCTSVASEDFARFLEKINQPRRAAGPQEPGEKTQGLSGEQLNHWLRTFGVEDDGAEEIRN